MFLVYGGDKELVVKSYVDASFDTDPDDSKSQTGTNGCGRGARPIGPGSCLEPVQMNPDEPGPMPTRPRPPPWAHEPRLMPPWVPIREEPGLMGWPGPNGSPVFY